MAALPTGAIAPDIEFPTLSGGKFSLQQALRSKTVVLAFFKISCPVCQYAFPYLERLNRSYVGDKVLFVGISQNDAGSTEAFKKQYGITFEIALDDTKKYPASNAYGLTNVPSIFLVGQDGSIDLSSVGWSKKDMEALNRKLANATEMSAIQMFSTSEQVAEFKAG